jgi:hypothetical protein
MPNDVTDNLWRRIRDPYAQSVLVQLLRLSWGHHKDECLVGLPKLAERCGFHLNQARKGKKILIDLGVIMEIGEDNRNSKGEMRGTRFRVLLKPPPTVKVAPTSEVSNKLKALKDIDLKGACAVCGGKGHYFKDPSDPRTFTFCRHTKREGK